MINLKSLNKAKILIYLSYGLMAIIVLGSVYLMAVKVRTASSTNVERIKTYKTELNLDNFNRILKTIQDQEKVLQ